VLTQTWRRPLKAIEVYRGTGIGVMYQSAEGGDCGFISPRDLREIDPAPARSRLVSMAARAQCGHHKVITIDAEVEVRREGIAEPGDTKARCRTASNHKKHFQGHLGRSVRIIGFSVIADDVVTVIVLADGASSTARTGGWPTRRTAASTTKEDSMSKEVDARG
jgi:hypothetical protein